LLVAWDLLLDPAMSKVTSYWIWGDTGSYYGMPWSNLFGWAVTGLMLFVILNKLAPEPRTALRFAVSVYLVNFALPVGFCMLNRYWLAVAAGTSAVVAALLGFGRIRKGGGSYPTLGHSYAAKSSASQPLS
jgi:putative membrane protein